MDRQGRMEKENKTLGTERCENIDTLHINKNIIIIIIIIIIVIFFSLSRIRWIFNVFTCIKNKYFWHKFQRILIL